jgi:hypothetical protein
METKTYRVPTLTLGQIRDASTNGGIQGWYALLDGLGQPHVGFDRTIQLTLGDIARINAEARDFSSVPEDWQQHLGIDSDVKKIRSMKR